MITKMVLASVVNLSGLLVPGHHDMTTFRTKNKATEQVQVVMGLLCVDRFDPLYSVPFRFGQIWFAVILVPAILTVVHGVV